MHAIFAIEPSAINNYHELRYIVEKFGWSKGLLIAKIPGKWDSLVRDGLKANGVKPRELKRIEAILEKAKRDATFKLGLPFQQDETWLNNVFSSEILNSLDAVLVAEELQLDKCVSLVSVSGEMFENRREVQVERRSENLAKAAEYVARANKTIYLVDRYFSSDEKCLKFLDEIIDLACKPRGNLTKVVVISGFDQKNSLPYNRLKASYLGRLVRWTGKGVKFCFYRLDMEKTNWDFHARYLFSEKAGLRYDRGFVEPFDPAEKSHKTDIVCLDKDVVEQLNTKYVDEIESLCLVDSIELDRTDGIG